MLPKYIYRDFYITASDMLKLKRHLKKTINNIEPCPKFANKRGIVMCAGGIKYFTDAWVTISMLRETGATDKPCGEGLWMQTPKRLLNDT